MGANALVHSALHRSTLSTIIVALLSGLLAGWFVDARCFAQRESVSTIATRFRSINEVIEKWSQDRQLYVHGTIGVGDAQLRELGEWLRANGPHWVVVLMDNAEGQTYTSQQGIVLNEMDAVEMALGKGLSNLTDFGKQVHPETKESDGCVFVIYLKERKFAYFASDAQDTRDLGEAHWIGDLDQPAVRAMRSGGRVIDAVKDTVKTVNGKLSRAIAAEKNAQLQRAQQRQRQVAQVKNELAELRVTIGEVEAAGLAFAKEFPKATGPLAKPPIKTWQDRLVELEGQLNEDTTSEIEQKHAVLAAELSRYLNAYAARAGFRQEYDATNISLVSFKRSNSSRAQQIAADTQALLAQTSEQMESGQLEFLDTLSKTEANVKLGEKAAAEELQRQKLAEMQSRWIRATAIIILSFIALIVAAMLWLANRRRSTTMHKALEQVSTRLASISTETDRLDKLFQRNEDILGSRDNLQQRGYEGTTKQLSMRALDYVDDLFIMSKEVKRVVGEAQRLIHPADPWNKLVNLFSSERYPECH